ncbi:MAG TPA: aldehyde ferredoxin oxidoreductase family protein [Symbiobacteriaceae bacterium]|nr:aldehyde ferredoxin oxidoreductase family protein [Symbiobacteriaceae bacterium]
MDARIYYVDLTAGEIWTEALPDAERQKLPGGSGLAASLVMRHTPKGADPLGPENTLVMAVGPVTGMPIAGQSRMNAAAKSPLTGGIADAQAGGYFPAEMAMAGADAVVFLGRSPKPVYLYIRDGEAELRPAEHLWGKVTGEAEAAIRAELDDEKIEVAQIGPAGENLVKFAAIINMANRANGRTGLGAVMGSKNLKAVAVRGTRPLKPVHADGFRALFGRVKELEEANAGYTYFSKYGTPGILESQDASGGLPTRNWAAGTFAEAQLLSGERLYDEFMRERDTCYACPVKCKRVTDKPAGVDPVYGGPEYESIAALGSYCGHSDLAAVIRANEICNKYGLDTISTGAIIAWAMEAFEKGLITPAQTGGIDLRFGNAEAVVKVAELIARREGIGDLLAEGMEEAARRVGGGSEAFAVHAKGNPFPAHMPQVKRSLALVYAVNPYGADHQSSEHDPALESKPGTLGRQRLEHLGFTDQIGSRKLTPEKVRFAYLTQCFYAALDTLSLCHFVWGPFWQLFGPEETVELIRVATGWRFDLERLMKIGERRLNLHRAFNAREGLDRRHDKLPRRAFEPLTGGISDGEAVDETELERAKDLYYQMAGWDVATGVPTRAKLAELDLEWVAPMLGR